MGCGTLYLCATPIGNLSDITLRVLETLKTVDLIAAEDTRVTKKLLSHFDIHTPLTSYHAHNRYDKAKLLIEQLREGKRIALVTDAGSPVISDPGETLVALCAEVGIPVTSLPGACAAITALTLSGLDASAFCFLGFLPAPRDKKARSAAIASLVKETRTVILYEAPHRLIATLNELYDTLGERRIVLCRELTKLHEEILRLPLSEAATLYDEDHPPRGEYVLVLSGADADALRRQEQEACARVSVEEQVARYEAQGLDHKEAMKRVAKERGISRREVYRVLHQEKEEE